MNETLLRLNKFKDILKKQNLDSILVSSPENIFYLTNYKFSVKTDREAFLFITQDRTIIFISPMHQNRIHPISKHIEIKILKESLIKEASKYLKNKIIGFEDNNILYSQYILLSKITNKLIPLSDKLFNLRSQKSEYELEKIKTSQLINKKALKYTFTKIKEGLTEKQLAGIFYKKAEELGADDLSFATIVASGVNSADPHHITSRKKIKNNEIILIDCGIEKDSYQSDITRTIFYGNKNQKFEKIYQTVKKAHDKAISQIKKDLDIKIIDETIRNIFEKEKVLNNFWHTSGHGIGILTHEHPSIYLKTKGKIKPNMVFSIEPGLYFPDWGGIRIEDLVTINENGIVTIL